MQVNLSDLEVVNGKKSNIKAGEVTDAGKTYIVIVIDPSVNLGPSSSGKMTGVANSSGFKEFPGDLIGNLYIGRK